MNALKHSTITTKSSLTATTITSTIATGTTVIATTIITTTIATTIGATSVATTTGNTCGQPACSFSPDSTLYPNTCDCHQYFSCSNYVSSIVSCSAGMNFDSILRICTWPASVTCATG